MSHWWRQEGRNAKRNLLKKIPNAQKESHITVEHIQMLESSEVAKSSQIYPSRQNTEQTLPVDGISHSCDLPLNISTTRQSWYYDVLNWRTETTTNSMAVCTLTQQPQWQHACKYINRIKSAEWFTQSEQQTRWKLMKLLYRKLLNRFYCSVFQPF